VWRASAALRRVARGVWRESVARACNERAAWDREQGEKKEEIGREARRTGGDDGSRAKESRDKDRATRNPDAMRDEECSRTTPAKVGVLEAEDGLSRSTGRLEARAHLARAHTVLRTALADTPPPGPRGGPTPHLHLWYLQGRRSGRGEGGERRGYGDSPAGDEA
jgi:hypothetical protein